MLKTCIDCGDSFEVESGEFWKVRCLDCWLDKKAAESDGRRPPANRLIQHPRPAAAQENAALRQQITRLQEDLDYLEEENRRLLCQLTEIAGRLHRADTLADEFYENLPRLIQLCHPDRHGGSLGAQRVTQRLLHVRRSAPAFETEEVSS